MGENCYLLQFFKYDHLPKHLQDVSKPFCELAHKIYQDSGDDPMADMALFKLLEAKDCAVRAKIVTAKDNAND